MRWCYAAIVHVRFASVSGGITHRWLLDTKPSGRPGHGRTGRWRRQCQSVSCLTSGPAITGSSLIPAASSGRACHKPMPASHRLRGSARISVVTSYLYSTDIACLRAPSYSAPTSYRAHQMGPLGPGPGGRLSTHSGGLWSARPPPGQTLHCVPRPMALGDSKPGSRSGNIKEKNGSARLTDPP